MNLSRRAFLLLGGFLTMKIDMIEPIRYRIIQQAGLPANSAVGSVVYNTVNKTLQFWDGANWIVLGPPANMTAGLPAAPSPGQMVFDSSTNTMQFWNGVAWQAIGPPQFRDVPFNAGDFTAGGGMVWTVAAGNIASFQFLDFLAPTKMMFINLYLFGSAVAVGGNQQLIVKIPNGRIVAKQTQSVGFSFQGVPPVPGAPITCLAPVGSDKLFLIKLDVTNWAVDPADTAVAFQILLNYV